jgi:hypothetical protein
MIAAANGHRWVIERLALMPGFDANVKNARGETLADVAEPLETQQIKPEPPVRWVTPSPGPPAQPSRHGQANSG